MVEEGLEEGLLGGRLLPPRRAEPDAVDAAPELGALPVAGVEAGVAAAERLRVAALALGAAVPAEAGAELCGAAAAAVAAGSSGVALVPAGPAGEAEAAGELAFAPGAGDPAPAAAAGLLAPVAADEGVERLAAGRVVRVLRVAITQRGEGSGKETGAESAEGGMGLSHRETRNR